MANIHPQGMRRVLNSCFRELEKAEAALEEGDSETCLVHYRQLAIYMTGVGQLLTTEIKKATSTPYRKGKDHEA